MAKIIQNYDCAICMAAEPVKKGEQEWDPWRKCYVGQIGCLQLCESEKKYPGQQFLRFGSCDPQDPWYLKTSYGKITIEGTAIIFTTANSRYDFLIQQKADQ